MGGVNGCMVAKENQEGDNATMGRHTFKCYLCAQTIEHGKVLACQHTFCHQCIQNDYINHKTQDKVFCPVKACQQVTDLPSMMIADLQEVDQSEQPMCMDQRCSTVSTHSFDADNGVKDSFKASTDMSPPHFVMQGDTVVASGSGVGHSQQYAASAHEDIPVRVIPYKSTLQTEEQLAALKKKRALLKWQMSVPDQTKPPLVRHNGSEDFNPQLVQRSHSVHNPMMSAGRPALRPYESVLSTDAQRNALLRCAKKLQQQAALKPQIVAAASNEPKPTGFTTRNSKPKREPPKSYNILTGGISALFFATRECEMEFRTRREGPWGYCDKDHWDGRTWGEAD